MVFSNNDLCNKLIHATHTVYEDSRKALNALIRSTFAWVHVPVTGSLQQGVNIPSRCLWHISTLSVKCRIQIYRGVRGHTVQELDHCPHGERLILYQYWQTKPHYKL